MRHVAGGILGRIRRLKQRLEVGRRKPAENGAVPAMIDTPRGGGYLSGCGEDITARGAPENEADDGAASTLDAPRPQVRDTSRGRVDLPDGTGATSDSRYQLLEMIGQGGMGRVWSAWDRELEREVALKELLPELMARGERDPDSQKVRRAAAARFAREARVTARLQHPAIIPVHEVGVRAGGTPFYTMRLLRGQTLQMAITSAPGLRERLALLPHYIDACQAMAYAHANAIIHRDLKPSNVLLGEFGETVVIDWGLAKRLQADNEPDELSDESAVDYDAGTNLTNSGQLLGTVHYMSPEQATGRREILDTRSDVYALGAMLYHLLVGARPFGDLSQIEVLRRLPVESPPAPDTLCKGLPPALVAICRRAMARRPEDRYANAEELAGDVERFLSGAVVSAHDYGLSGHFFRLMRRHRQVAFTAGLSALLLLATTAYAFHAIQARAQRERAARELADRTVYAMQINAAHRELKAMNFAAAESRVKYLSAPERGWEWGYLYYAMNRKMRPVSSHRAYAPPSPDYTDLDLAKNGGLLLTADQSGCVNLWSLRDDCALHTMQTHEAKLMDAKLHPNGRFFASSAEDGEVCVWDITTDQRLARHEVGREAREIAFSPDGDLVLIAGPGHVVEWDWRVGEVAATFLGDGAQMNSVAVSPSGTLVAAGDGIGMLYVWERATGARKLSTMAHPRDDTRHFAGTLDLAFRPQDDKLATCGSDGTVKLWDYQGGLLDTFNTRGNKVWSAAWYPDGRRLVSIDNSGAATVHLPDGAAPPGPLIECGECQEVEVSAEETQLYIVSYLQNALVVSPEDPGAAFLEGHHTTVAAIAFSPDSRVLYSVAGGDGEGLDSRLLAWEVPSYADAPRMAYGVPLDSINISILREEPVPRVVLDSLARRGNCLALHPDGSLLAIGDGGGTVHLLDLASESPRGTISIPEWGEGIRALAFRPDGAELAVAGWGADPGRHIAVYGVADLKRRREMGNHERQITDVAYAPDGRYIATGARDGYIALWNAVDDALLRRIGRAQPRAGFAFDITERGDKFLLMRGDGGLMYWHPNWEKGAARDFDGVRGQKTSATFSPDGRLIVGTGLVETGVWDERTGVLLFTLPHAASRAAFSPDGRTLATAGLDGRIGLWHALPWEPGLIDTNPRYFPE